MTKKPPKPDKASMTRVYNFLKDNYSNIISGAQGLKNIKIKWFKDETLKAKGDKTKVEKLKNELNAFNHGVDSTVILMKSQLDVYENNISQRNDQK